MIEISRTVARQEEKKKIKGKKKSRSLSGSNPFSTELQRNIEFEFNGTIDELVNDLRDQEKRFLRDQTFQEMIKYKSLVKKILKSIIENGYQTRTIKRSRKDRADFTVISEIDERLEKISAAITKSSTAFNLLKTVEEIRGLIFDLVY